MNFPQNSLKRNEDLFLRKLYYKSGKLSMLPFNGSNSHAIFKMISREKKLRDTSYWALNINEFDVFQVQNMQAGNYTLSDDTIFQMKDKKIKSCYVLKDSLLSEISNMSLKNNLCLVLNKKDSIRSIINSQLDAIKKDYENDREGKSDGEIVEVSDIYLIKGGDALVVFSLASLYGLKQELYLFHKNSSNVHRIHFPKSVFRFYDFNGEQIVGQYEIGGEFFISEINATEFKCEKLIELVELKGDYKDLKFVSKGALLGLKREPLINGPLPISIYNISKSQN
jgi:hypothetical protein